MTTIQKIQMRYDELTWKIEDCEADMKRAHDKLVMLMGETPMDIANFAESYARVYKEALEQKRIYEEERRILALIAKEDN